MLSEAARRLLDEAQQSGLLREEEIEAATEELQATDGLARDQAAARLVEKQILTAYQAEELVAGRGEECLLAGRYCLLARLGAGGMGEVYRAEDRQLERIVAIKVIAPRHVEHPDAVARFRREAKALAKVSHPAIVQAYDAGEDCGRHFLVMEFVEGTSLAQLLHEKGRIPPALAADYVYQAAIGLDHAHQKGLVHRDVKPGNLLLTPDRQIKILDLGLARFVQDQIGDGTLTREGLAVGTPDYMAPEQFGDSRHVDLRADIYSLGCTLYQLLTGRVPFPGSSLSEKARAHCEQEPTPLEESCPEAPAGLIAIVRRMMAKRPEDRFQTAGEVAEALLPHVSGSSAGLRMVESTAAWQGSRPGVPVSRRRRLRAVLGVSAGVVLLASFLVAGLIYLRQSGNREPGETPESPPLGETQAESPAPSSDPNVITVAKDGSGMFHTIGEALDKVKPGQTIRVLDSATYQEKVSISRADHRGITLETPAGATIKSEAGQRLGLVVLRVPHVTVRGFHIEGSAETSHSVIVAGKSPGTLLEELTVRGSHEDACGISLEWVRCENEDPPVVVRRCRLSDLLQGIRVSGMDKPGEFTPCSGVLVYDNVITNCRVGIATSGQVNNAQIVGNRVWEASSAGMSFYSISEGSGTILVANNTLQSAGNCVAIEDPDQRVTDLTICQNLLLTERGPDMVLMGKDPKPLPAWKIEGNWRQARPPERSDAKAGTWIPPTKDKLLTSIDFLSKNRDDPKFLRPPKASPLATAGAGGDLPSYVGAMAPEGAGAWDWQKTWDSRHPKMLLTVSKDPKDGGEFRTIGEALSNVKRPGMTVRVLDDATYPEVVKLSLPSTQAGLTLEALKGATIAPPKSVVALGVWSVPRVTVRGFRLRAECDNIFLVGVVGRSAGVVLEDLRLEAGQATRFRGVTIETLDLSPEDEPVVVRRCTMRRPESAVRVGGASDNYRSPSPCARIRICDNTIEEPGVGIILIGSVKQTQIAGNRISGATLAGIQLENLFPESGDLLIANNTLSECFTAMRLRDDRTKGVLGANIQVRNNLVLASSPPDIVFVDSGGDPINDAGFGDGKALLQKWQFGTNWREGKPPGAGSASAAGWVPAGPSDVVRDRIEVLSRDRGSVDYLKPAKDSPLATGGAGGNVPKYVGALPPPGVDAWDWDQTWQAAKPAAKLPDAAKPVPAEKLPKQK